MIGLGIYLLCFVRFVANQGIDPLTLAPGNEVCFLPGQRDCSIPGNFTERYKPVKGKRHGGTSNVRFVQDMVTGEEYAVRYPKSPQAKQDEHSVVVGRLVCHAPHMMKLHGVECWNGRSVQVWSRCAGDLIKQVYGNHGCPAIQLHEIKKIAASFVEVLQYTLSRGVLLNDVVDVNVLYSHKDMKICLIDYGGVRLENRFFLLGAEPLKIEQYMYRLMRNMQLKRTDPILQFANIFSNLLGIKLERDWKFSDFAALLGSKDLEKYAKKYEIDLHMHKPTERVAWDSLLGHECRSAQHEEAVDFLSGFMRYSYMERLKFLVQACLHPFLRGQCQENLGSLLI